MNHVVAGRRARLAEALARRRVPMGFAAGAVVLWLARPTWRSLAAGALVALAGQALRIWAAGHLEKDREVTATGPYRWIRHPLYAGSTLMGLGLIVAAARPAAGLLVAAYLLITLTAAVRTEEAFLRGRFGARYDAYRQGRQAGEARPFGLRRAFRVNREHRALVGLAIALLLLGVKVAFG